MRQFAKISFLTFLTLGILMYSFADRGLRKKSKNHVILNVTSAPNFQSSLSDNLKNGLKYKGLLLSETKSNSIFLSNNYINTFQKGNTIYLLPKHQKLIIPEMVQGYTGMKLVLKSKD